jgi:hypothetical protein
VHVLRLLTGELVYPAQVRPKVGEDGSDYPSDISRSTIKSSIAESVASIGPADGEAATQEFSIGAGSGKA